MLKLHRQIKLDRYTVPYGEVWYIASSMQLQEEEFFGRQHKCGVDAFYNLSGIILILPLNSFFILQKIL